MAEHGCVLQFAKAPVPGRTKTRLQPALSPTDSAAVARALIAGVARSLRALPPGWNVTLCCDDPAHEYLRAIAQANRFGLGAQGGGDLGERMERAAAGALARHDMAVIVGSDCTGYDAAYLREATQALERGTDAVLGAASDGGYVLIGLRRLVPGLFSGIAWGSTEVADAQRERLRRHALSWHELPLRDDIDRPQDLWMLCPALRPLRAQALVMARLSP